MKYLFLFLLLLVSCRSSTQPEFEGEVVTRVWYEAEANLTWVEYQDVEYKGEKWAVIEDSTFIDLFLINQHFDHAFNTERDFTHSIKPGMNIWFRGTLFKPLP